jgi:hypothetical protein
MPAPSGPHDPTATGTTAHDDLLQLLLEVCEDFFAHTNAAARDEVDRLLLTRGSNGGPGWLIDMLALTRLRLQNQAHHDDPGAHHDA